ncbi:hypothetical protein U9M48_038129 [Paspalum notatum var. saurae]|uniref:Uncharacterized protein n=1 Tax=Paspalum notatum var. saurae TaxID=547442 RepID=A0AAQ3XA13_PASNO
MGSIARCHQPIQKKQRNHKVYREVPIEMASCFILQKLASGATRSTSLLGAHPSSSARTATNPGTLSNLFHGDAAHHPSDRGIHDCRTTMWTLL